MLTIACLCTLTMYLLGGVAKPETPQDAAVHPHEANTSVLAIATADVPSLPQRTPRGSRG